MAARNEGFDEFFDAHYAPVVRSLGLAFGDRPAAEDAAQEAFARARRRWHSVRGMDRPVGWVYVVAMNVARRTAKREGNGQVDASCRARGAADRTRRRQQRGSGGRCELTSCGRNSKS
jgi:DNA-directed RNA polymerase specialized sigma24 family protein